MNPVPAESMNCPQPTGTPMPDFPPMTSVERLQNKLDQFFSQPSSQTIFECISEVSSNEWHRDSVTPGIQADFADAVEHLRTSKNVAAAARALLDDRNFRTSTANRVILLYFLLIRFRCCGEVVSDAFNWILENKLPCSDIAARELVKLKWRYEGPAEALLHETTKIQQSIQTNGITLELLSLLIYLEESRLIKSLLNEKPWLMKCYDQLLPLTKILVTEMNHKNESLLEYHAFHEILNANSRSLDAMIGDTATTIAIVGNSPCETAKHKGRTIDAHDLVARFNYCPLTDDFELDYGKKMTFHIRGAKDDVELAARSKEAQMTILNQYDFIFQPRRWQPLLDLHRAGIKLACLPKGHHFPLQTALQAEPSLGLSFLAYVKSMRGILKAEQCFGFAFVDQLNGKAHYFDNLPPAYTHNWKQELELFKTMID